MAEASPIARAHPLAGRRAGTGGVSITPAPPAARFSLRVGSDAFAALSSALGLALPQRSKRSAVSDDGARAALWLGPDEWLLIDESGGDPASDIAGVDALFSAVDISHRNTGLMLTGEGAEAVLSTGCPQDVAVAAFPVGSAARTVLGKIEIVVWRRAEDVFRIECWRSYSDYAFSFLQQGACDWA